MGDLKVNHTDYNVSMTDLISEIKEQLQYEENNEFLILDNLEVLKSIAESEITNCSYNEALSKLSFLSEFVFQYLINSDNDKIKAVGRFYLNYITFLSGILMYIHNNKKIYPQFHYEFPLIRKFVVSYLDKEEQKKYLKFIIYNFRQRTFLTEEDELMLKKLIDLLQEVDIMNKVEEDLKINNNIPTVNYNKFIYIENNNYELMEHVYIELEKLNYIDCSKVEWFKCFTVDGGAINWKSTKTNLAILIILMHHNKLISVPEKGSGMGYISSLDKGMQFKSNNKMIKNLRAQFDNLTKKYGNYTYVASPKKYPELSNKHKEVIDIFLKNEE